MKMFKKDNRGIGKGLVVVIIAIIAVIAAGGFIFAQTLLKDPFTRLMSAYAKMYSERQQNVTVDMSVSLDKENAELKKLLETVPDDLGIESSKEQVVDFISKVLPKFTLRYGAMANIASDPVEFGTNVSLLYDGKELIDAGAAFKPWEVTISSKSLLSKPIYGNFSEDINTAVGADVSGFQIGKYIDIIYEKDDFIKSFGKSKYVEILKTALKEKLTAEGSNKIILNITQQESIDLLVSLLNEAAKDEALKNSVLAKYDKLAALVISSGDYKLTGISEEEFKKNMEEGRKELADNWEKAVTELAGTYTSAEFKSAMEIVGNPAFRYVFTLENDMIKAAEGEFTMSGLTVKYASSFEKFTRDGYTFGTADNSYDLKGLVDGSGDAMGVALDALSKVSAVLTGDAYKSMESDITSAAKESLSAGDAQIVEEALKNLLNMTSMMQ